MSVAEMPVTTIEHRVGVHNTEYAYNTQEPVVGDIARRLGEEICGRWVWLDMDTIILPSHPGNEFLEYAATFGRSPHVIVPQSVNTQALSMHDGFSDPAFQQAMQNAEVVSFVPDPQLGEFVALHGGSYCWENSGAAAGLDNKVNFRDLTQELRKLQLFDVPEGIAMSGIHRIAGRVRQRLRLSGRAYVRHGTLGGGFGNHAFDASHHVPSLVEIEYTLCGNQSELWVTADALIEKFLSFRHLPAVTFDAANGFGFDDLQIVKNGSYKGLWAPIPDYVCPPERLVEIGNKSAAVADKNGHAGSGNMDLGKTFDGKLIGLEFNMRKTAATHVQALGELLLGPHITWRKEKYAVKSLDAFYLNGSYTFKKLFNALESERLLATPENPFGAVISIPPSPDGKVAGLHIQSRGDSHNPNPYRNAEITYHKILEIVGDPENNTHDNPLL